MYTLLKHNYSEQELIEMSKGARVLKIFNDNQCRNGILLINDKEQLIFVICMNGYFAWTYEGKVGEIRDINGDLINSKSDFILS